jgi:hypothetical protein
MQGRFKMEYRLFTIVRYNYEDYNTPSKPNMHARIRANGRVDYDQMKRNSGRKARRQEKFKKLEVELSDGREES